MTISIGRRTRDLDGFDSISYRICAYHFDGADVTLLAADVTLETSGSAVVLGTSIPLLTESAWDAVAQLLQ